jgi:hypothetical protein
MNRQNKVSFNYSFRLFPFLLLFFLLVQSYTSKAGEGMWLPQLLKALNEKEMKSMGMKISADDIYSVNKGSLKDAIVHFGGFCTSEVISSKGLLLTNHHCGYGQIQNHSTVENNLLKNGFWAKTHADELPNPGLTATFIDYIDDVTSKIIEGVTYGMTASERQSLVDKNIERVSKGYSLGKHQKVMIRSFYDGNQYFAFVTTTFSDVRLVGTPPESIGKFGADTDNWVWPRHTGDFAFFRIYADKNNQPAEYSKDNVPYTPKHFLPVAMDGVEPGDFTMVFGFPGRTTQYLPEVAVDQILNTLNPARIAIRETSLGIMDKYMRKDEKIKIQYSAKYASLANAYKKWIGENLGLKKSKALDKKEMYENSFALRLEKNSPYNGLLSEMNRLYDSIGHYALAREYYAEILQRNVDLTSYMFTLQRLVSAYENNGEAGFQKIFPGIKSGAENFYKDVDIKIDVEKFGALLTMFIDNLPNKFVPGLLQRGSLGIQKEESYHSMAAELYTQSSLTSYEDISEIFSKDPKTIVELIKKDPLYGTIYEWSVFANKNFLTPYNTFKAEIDLKQAMYTKAQLEKFPEKRFYPDANSTLRVTYGQVNGYSAQDAVNYHHVTYLDGVLEKYKPGDYEFDLPKKYIELYNKKEFGRYADKNGKLPVCFIASNHTTGGNSGSPGIDAYGNLIGINFDRVWEGTMSDINYDASICRNIMVDARYILWVVDVFAGAGHLVDEMKLVHPKGKKKKKKKMAA